MHFSINETEYTFEQFYFIPIRITHTSITNFKNTYNKNLVGQGGIYKNTKILPRIITITGAFTGIDSFGEQQDGLVRLLNKLSLPELKLHHDNLTIEAFYIGGLEGNTDSLSAGEPATIRFLCPYPLWKSDTEINISLSKNINQIIDISGTVPINQFEIYFTGTGTNSFFTSFENKTTGDKILCETFDALYTEEVFIKLEPGILEIVTSANRELTEYLNPQSTIANFQLLPGENVIRATCGDGVEDLKITYTPIYWGIE
jgi:hypothetical protein